MEQAMYFISAVLVVKFLKPLLEMGVKVGKTESVIDAEEAGQGDMPSSFQCLATQAISNNLNVSTSVAVIVGYLFTIQVPLDIGHISRLSTRLSGLTN